jgi:membrane-bound ClpP family serine protease
MDQLEGIVIKDGDSGKSVSRLAPSGKAIINNEIVEVHTFGEFIDQEVEITVISVKDNKIFVTLKKSNS